MGNSMTTIGKVAEVFDGPHATPKKIENGPFFLSISSLENGRLDLSKSARLSEADFVKWTKRVTPQKGDLLFSYETRLGEAALMPDGIRACLGRRMGLLRPREDKVIPEYLLYAYMSPAFQQTIVANTITGATVDRIALNEMPSFDIRIPGIDEQKKVASVLRALDAKIDCNNRINAELEAMAKTLYDYWFVQFDFPFDFAQGRPDAHGKPYKSSGGKMVYNSTLKREIPAGWGAKLLADVGSFKNGINYDPSVGGNATARIVNVRNVSATTIFLKENDLDALDLEQAEIDKYLVTSDSILIARSGIPGATRMMSFCPPNTIYCGFIICMTVANPEDKLFLFFKMKQIEQSLLSQSSGSILKNVSQDTLKAICIAMPPDDLRSVIQSFNAAINPILGKLSLNQQANNQLTELRDWLLPMLMNGQVTVA